MVSVDKLQRGMARFIDAELAPSIEGKDKWILTGMATLYLAKLPGIVAAAKQNPAVKLAGVISDDGLVDIEAIINSVRPAARQTAANISIPFGGTLKFTESDLDKIYNYIQNA